MPYITIQNKKIYCEEYGYGKHPTLVYLHGGPGESCLTYTHQAQVLGEYFHFISFDQYGVFRSDSLPANERAGVRYHVDLLEEMRLALGIERWIPLGHSFGGMLAVIYAHTYPASIDAVIYDCPMWSALHTARTIAERVLPYYQQHGEAEKIALCEEILGAEITPRSAFEKSLQLEMHEELMRFCHAIEMTDYQAYLDSYLTDPNVPEDCWYRYTSFTQKLLAEDDFYEDYLPYLAEIEKPQLLIVGEYDMTCGENQQQFFCEHAPVGKRVILRDSAHLSWMQQPEQYTETIREFAERI